MADKHGNDGYLEGMECPACHQSAVFTVGVHGLATLRDVTGITDAGELTCDADDFCECPACNYDGTVRDFKLPNEEQLQDYDRVLGQLRKLAAPARRLVEYQAGTEDPYVLAQLDCMQRALQYHEVPEPEPATPAAAPVRTRHIDVQQEPADG